jgi:hypothetical protein
MRKLIFILSLIALPCLAQEVRVTLTAAQYAAVQAAVAAANTDTNAVPITTADVLKRYADRLVQIQSQTRKTVVIQKFEAATEPQKAAIEAEAAKVVIAPKEEPKEEPIEEAVGK